jgi:hypothetical protein
MAVLIFDKTSLTRNFIAYLAVIYSIVYTSCKETVSIHLSINQGLYRRRVLELIDTKSKVADNEKKQLR